MADTFVRLPPLVDANGNINIHGRDGANISLVLQTFDGQPRDDAADVPLYFEIEGVLRRELEPGLEPGERILRLTLADVAKLSDDPLNFIFNDESNIPAPIWFGTIRRFGFTAEPPEG